MSTVCKFTQGPAAGTTHDYAPLAPVAVGTRCDDQKGSTGSVILPPGDNQHVAAASAASSSAANSQGGSLMNTVCGFNQGPAAGTTHDYAPLDPLPVGTACSDGKGSTGMILLPRTDNARTENSRADSPRAGAVAPGTNAGSVQQQSTVCSFSQGPAAGTTHDYAPLDPLPVGTACNDGKGSTGTIIAKADDPPAGAAAAETNAGNGQQVSTVCSFKQGPAAGTTHDYAPLDPLPVGTGCNDGAGSTGVIIARASSAPPATNVSSYSGAGPALASPNNASAAPPSYAGPGTQQLSTVCKFTSGPAAGSLHDYAPLDPIPVGSACNDGKGSIGKIIARTQY